MKEQIRESQVEEYKDYSENDILKYVDNDYFEETSYTKGLRQLLSFYYNMTQTEQTGLISLIHDLTITGMPLDTVLSLIPRHLEMNDPRLNSDINELVTYIYYSSPQWIYKGHTYYELNPDKIPTDSVLAAPQPIVRKQKINRNAPCPCGSGKKYKHCCLK